MEENKIIENIPFKVTVQDVLQTMQMKRSNPSVEKTISELLEQAEPIANPKALYRAAFVDITGADEVTIDGSVFKGSVLRMNLEKAGRVFPYVVTAGRELDAIKVPKSDMMASFCYDAVREHILEQAFRYMESRLTELYALGSMAHMSPGSLAEWPISEQKRLFDLFGDVEELIGVRLTPSMLMDPVKSVSGIYFPTEVGFESCMLCTRHPCSKRRAPYDSEMAKRYRKG
jgi:hypothetical protein